MTKINIGPLEYMENGEWKDYKPMTLEDMTTKSPEDDAMGNTSLSTFLDWQEEHLSRLADDDFNSEFKNGARWLLEKVRAHEAERLAKLPTEERINDMAYENRIWHYSEHSEEIQKAYEHGFKNGAASMIETRPE